MPPPDTRGDGRTKPEWGKREEPAPAARRMAKGEAPTKGTARAKGGPGGQGPRQGQGGDRPPGLAGTAWPAARGKGPTGRTKASSRVRRLGKRYGVVYDTSGPRVRLGMAWFVVAFAAIVAGSLTTALVYGMAAALAAAQMARAWRKHAPRPSDVMAAGGAALIAGGATFGAGGAGLGMLGAVGLAFVASNGDQRSPNPRIADVGWTLQCSLVPGIVAMSMVLLVRLDQGSAIALLLMVSVYETGDYLVGSGAANPYEGPAAGVAAIVVVTFIVSTLPISALSFGEAWLFGGLVALLAPAGQLLASGFLPSAATPASGLRRLDSLLLTAPSGPGAWGSRFAAGRVIRVDSRRLR